MLPQMRMVGVDLKYRLTQVPGFYLCVDLVVCGLVDSLTVLTIEHAAPDPWFGPGKDPQVDHGILTEAEL